MKVRRPSYNQLKEEIWRRIKINQSQSMQNPKQKHIITAQMVVVAGKTMQLK